MRLEPRCKDWFNLKVRGRAGAAALGLVAAVQLASTLAAQPTSLAWTPPPFSDGYRFVSDSSIDYGQALRAVRRSHETDPFVAVSLVTPRGLGRPPGTRPVVGADPADLVGRIAVLDIEGLVKERVRFRWEEVIACGRNEEVVERMEKDVIRIVFAKTGWARYWKTRAV